MRRMLAVLVVLVSVGCSSSSKPAATATAVAAVTTTTTPLADRARACDYLMTVASNNVRALLAGASATVVTQGTPAAIAAKLRVDVAATNELVENSRKQCATTLVECPTAQDEYAAWLKQQTALVTDLADGMLGGLSTTSAAPTPPPKATCAH